MLKLGVISFFYSIPYIITVLGFGYEEVHTVLIAPYCTVQLLSPTKTWDALAKAIIILKMKLHK